MNGIPSHVATPAEPARPQKVYASENDATTPNGHRAAPQTPSKASPSPAEVYSQKSAFKQRSKNKIRAKNTPTSPEIMPQAGRQTPPHRPGNLKPAICAAFAGATFHASPAPSALPIPSFVTRSLSDTPAQRGAREVVQEPSPPATDTDAPTPLRTSSAPRSHESPLDFMFRAHRQEKERNGKDRAASSGQNTTARSPQPLSRLEVINSPTIVAASQARQASSKSPFDGLDDSEQVGNQNLPMGPAFSAPYQERIKAARSDYARPHTQRMPEAAFTDAASAEDPAEALKKFLFGTPKREQGPMSTSLQTAHKPQKWTTDGLSPGPSHSNNIQAMENDLRRILKLDLA
ncbi:hypothetical protein CDD80_3148 [Ophiocordyceps camponoti-rufipedis]|uniref:Proteophosphoglycan 5 n=1 Tax=Ophiocordyceps camponoti-rufipedis TaxID=2004952 RepID=A0A2C5XWG1_9HYPO|nr:hypothetical protein CDD80_3148 [Ophiocordyceps camponoti-rufipedis]